MSYRKTRALRTIGALRDIAENYKAVAAHSRVTAAQEKLNKGTKATLLAEAEACDTVALDFVEIANELQHFRSIDVARHIMGPSAMLREEDAYRLVNEIRQARALLEHSGSVASNVSGTVRLVPFYDSAGDEEKFAVELRQDSREDLVSDYHHREDAEYRYWELAVTLGAVKPQ